AGNSADIEIASLDSSNRVSLAGASGGSLTNEVDAPKIKGTGGVVNSGSGLMHFRGASCTTGASLNAACNTTITWPGTWADTNYTATCTLDSTTSGQATLVLFTFNKSTTQMVVTITNNNTNALATSGTINCTAMHD